MLTVKELRNLGYKVRVRHNRAYCNKCNCGAIHPRILPTGGFTEVALYKGDKLLGNEKAVCHKKDNYNKKLGVRIALGRLLKYSEDFLYNDQKSHPKLIRKPTKFSEKRMKIATCKG